MNLRKILLVAIASLALPACATQKKAGTGMMQSDVYTGMDTVEFLATGVKDRVFFATNKSTLTTASRDTLRKQAAWMRKKKDVSVSVEGHADERGTREYNLALGERRANAVKDLTFTIEGHADERGTREYNLALGERRANAAKDYLMTYGISGSRLSVISYGKERPVNSGSDPLAWSQNRRAVTVKAN